jgi:hypothetical protein
MGFLITFSLQQSARCEVTSFRAFMVSLNTHQQAIQMQLDALTFGVNQISGLGPKPSDDFENWRQMMRLVLKGKKKGQKALEDGVSAHRLALEDCDYGNTLAFVFVILNAALAGFVSLILFRAGQARPQIGGGPDQTEGRSEKSDAQERTAGLPVVTGNSTRIRVTYNDPGLDDGDPRG